MRGFVGSPENTRINRTGQKFFINRRPVQSIAFSIALSRAYEEFLQPRRFPVAILFFDIDLKNADGSPQRWKVVGKPIVWETKPGAVKIQVKSSLVHLGIITEQDLQFFTLDRGEHEYKER